MFLPSSVATFPRHGWLNSEQSLAQCVLLSVHNVLPRAGMLWLSKKESGKAVPLFSDSPAARWSHSSWDLSDSAHDGGEEQPASKPPESVVVAAADNPATYSTAFNTDQKSKADRFFRSAPRDRLVVVRIAVQPAVNCLRVVEHIAADSWQLKHWCNTAEGAQPQSWIEAAALGEIQKAVDESCRRLLTSSESWAPVRPLGRTLGLSSVSLSMLLTSWAALESLCSSVCRGFPFALFLLLSGPPQDRAAEILKIRRDLPCMSDDFSKRFV